MNLHFFQEMVTGELNDTTSCRQWQKISAVRSFYTGEIFHQVILTQISADFLLKNSCTCSFLVVHNAMKCFLHLLLVVTFIHTRIIVQSVC